MKTRKQALNFIALLKTSYNKSSWKQALDFIPIPVLKEVAEELKVKYTNKEETIENIINSLSDRL